MDRATLYREQAAYCAYLLSRVRDPGRRNLLERERQDWLLLADRQDLWTLIDEPDARPRATGRALPRDAAGG